MSGAENKKVFFQDTELATWLNRKHGQVGFYLAQGLTGHGWFNAYLKRFKKRDDESSRYCGYLVENEKHTLFVCTRWGAERETVGRAVGAQLTFDTMVSSCTSLNRYGCLSSHMSPWWWRRGSSVGVQSAATTGASRNRTGTCTPGPASWADLVARVERRRNLFIPPLVGVAIGPA